MCDLFFMKDAIPCDCDERIDIEWENGTKHYPMFPWTMDEGKITYKCGVCGKESTFNMNEVKADKPIFGYNLNSEGYFSWKCPTHGINEVKLSSTPTELSEKLLVSVKNHYSLPCCIQIKKKKGSLSFEKLYQIRKAMDLNDQREEKWLSSATKEELLGYLNFIILQESKKDMPDYGSISTKAMNKNIAFFDTTILEVLYKYPFLELWYRMGSLSDSKMVNQAIKKDCVVALDFYAQRNYFQKESVILKAKNNAEKFSSTKCMEWLNKL